MFLTKTINKPVTQNGLENKKYNKKKKTQKNKNGTFVKRCSTWRFQLSFVFFNFNLFFFACLSKCCHTQLIIITNTTFGMAAHINLSTKKIYYICLSINICLYVWMNIRAGTLHSIDKN